MVHQLDVHSKLEVCATIRYLLAKRLNCTDIHREITAVYGVCAICCPGIVKWCKQFDAGCTALTDEYRAAGQQCPVTIANVDSVDEIIRENQCITLQEIASMLNISYGSVFSIVHEHLGFRKLCQRWVPHLLTDVH